MIYRVVVALVALFGLAPPSPAQEQPVRGGTLTFGVNAADLPTYDCHQSAHFSAVQLLSPHYSNLLKVDAQQYPKVVGDLAENWEVSPDAKTYTFKLRGNVKFHDGSAFSSEDIKASYERIRNPPQGVVSVRRGLFADVETIDTPDSLTVVFKLKQPNRALIYEFADPLNCVYSAARLKQNPLYPARSVMGTGPFRFVQHIAKSHWTGERFKGYFKADLPYLDGFRASFKQGPALISALQGGQIMTEFRSVTPADRDRLAAALGSKIAVQEGPWLGVMLLTFNAKKPPFNDPRVRKALSISIDRWRAAEVLPRSSTLRYVGTFMRPGAEFAGHEADMIKIFAGYSRDIEASRTYARGLLTDAKVPKLKVRLLNRAALDPFTAGGAYIIDQWRQIGVETEHVQANDPAYDKAANDRNFDAVIDFQADLVDSPNIQLAHHLSVDLSQTRGGYTDRAVDELYNRQKDETDPHLRYWGVHAFEHRMLDEAYTVPLLWGQRIVVMRSNVRGWSMTPSHLIGQDLETVWLKP